MNQPPPVQPTTKPKTIRVKSSVTFAPNALMAQSLINNGSNQIRPSSSSSSSSQHNSISILKKKNTLSNNWLSGQENNNSHFMSNNHNGMFSTNDSVMLRSKSPLIDQTITSTIGGGPSFSSITDGGGKPAGLQSLAEEYRQRQRDMDDRLKKEIDHHKIASVFVKPQGDSVKTAASPLQPLSINQNGSNVGGVLLPFEQKPQKFVRSDRSIAMRIKETYEDQVGSLEHEKMDLIKKLNESLMELDRLNQEKGELNNKLISVFKFNRDAERHTLRSDDLGLVVDESLKEELRSEKAQGVCMREQLKYFEVERLRIRDSLKTADGVKENLVQDKGELDQILQLREKDLSSLKVEFEDTLARITAYQMEVDELRQLCLALKEMISGNKNEIHCSHGGRLSLRDQFDNLEKKYAKVVDQGTREMHEVTFRHQRKRKLLGANFLMIRIQDLANQRQQDALNIVKKYDQVKRGTIAGLLRMRRLLKNKRLSRLRKSLHHWYNTQLKPLRNLRQKEQVSLNLSKRNPVLIAFYKWRSAFSDSIIKYHYKQQKLLRMAMIKQQQDSKASREFFARWRNNINLRYSEWHKIQAIGKMLIRRDESRMRRGLYRWKAASLEVENTIQMQVMAQRFTVKTYVSSLFNAWKTVCEDNKNHRHSTLSRYWKSFRSNVMTQKQMRCQTLMLLREGKLRTHQNLLKSCFDGLKHHKQEEQLLKCTRELFQVELPRKETAVSDIVQLSQSDDRKVFDKALRNVLRIRTKKYYQYFRLWKDLTDEYHEKLRGDLKARVIKIYNRHLSQAFNKWIDFRGKAITSEQQLIISSWEVDNKNLANEITHEHIRIHEKKFHQKTQSAKSLKLLVMEAFQRHIRIKFMTWRQNVNQLQKETLATEKLAIKLQRRQKKLVFDIFRKKVGLLREGALGIKSGAEARQKLRDRLKARTYQRFIAHTQLMLNAKQRFLSILRKKDLMDKDESFKSWTRFIQFTRELKLEGAQNHKVQQIAGLQSVIGELSDQVEGQNQSIKALDERYSTTCKKVLSAAIYRHLHISQQYYFERWRQVLVKDQRASRIVIDSYNHAKRAQLAFFFRRWQQNGSQFIMQEPTIHNIQYEVRVISQVTCERERAINDHEASVEYLDTRLHRVYHESKVLQAKHSKCLSTIVNRVESNHSMFRLRYIMVQWRAHVVERKRCCFALTNAVQKTLWQNAFTSIRQYAQQRQQNDHQAKSLTRFFKLFTQYKLRSTFSRFKSQLGLKVAQISQQNKVETSKIVKEHSKLVKLVHKRVELQLVDHLRYNQTFDCFTAWKTHSEIQKALRVKSELRRELQGQREKKSSLIKWFSRLKATKSSRRNSEKLQTLYATNLARIAFTAWQEMNFRAKRFCRSLSNLSNKVDIIYTHRAFMTLKEHQDTQNTRILFAKFKSIQFLTKALQSVHDTRFHQAFTQFRENLNVTQENDLKVRSISKFLIAKKLREYINQWRQEANLRSVKIFNNSEGPVAVEAYNLQRQLCALKVLCSQEGISTEKVNKIIANTKAKSTEQIMRVVSRLLCQGNPQIKVIPSYFDRWRQWVKLRKLFKIQLRFTSNYVNPVRQGLSHAFKKWKCLGQRLKQELNSIRKEDLEYISVKNEEKINYMARTFEESAECIEDLTTQRDLLLVRYVGSQKLALSSIKAQNDRAKQKVVSRWLSQNQRGEKSQIESVLKANLLHIAALKDRIFYIEGQNQEIADQNEDLRQGALDGIEMAKSVDELSREREILTIDVADKALVIRRLLEDNQSLNSQLLQAQDAAQRLIHLTQRRFLNMQ